MLALLTLVNAKASVFNTSASEVAPAGGGGTSRFVLEVK